MHVDQCCARLDLVGWATSDGAAHVLSYGYRGSYPHTHVIFVEYDMYLCLLYFSHIWKKSWMGTRLLEFGGIRLVIN